MKKISPSIVMVEDISSSLPRATFSETDLDEAAQLILKMEGTITPLILQKTGIDSYTVIEGDFEYYAALKAEELDPMKGETINAYVVESKKDLPFYEQQIEVFRKQSAGTPQPIKPTVESGKEPAISIPNQVSPVNLQPILNAIGDLSNQVKGIVNQQSKLNIKVDTNFSSLQEAIDNISVKQSETSVSTPITNSTASNFKADFLNEINTLSDVKLETKLKQAKANKTVTKNILLERKEKLFDSSLEVLIKRVDGLAEKTLIKILDNWS